MGTVIGVKYYVNWNIIGSVSVPKFVVKKRKEEKCKEFIPSSKLS